MKPKNIGKPKNEGRKVGAGSGGKIGGGSSNAASKDRSPGR